jgi:predicted porin
MSSIVKYKKKEISGFFFKINFENQCGPHGKHKNKNKKVK